MIRNDKSKSHKKEYFKDIKRPYGWTEDRRYYKIIKRDETTFIFVYK